jgi:hypothetical protein
MAFQILGPLSKRMAVAAALVLAIMAALVVTPQQPQEQQWGLLEMWIADPDGVRICIVEVPQDHPLRRRD